MLLAVSQSWGIMSGGMPDLCNIPGQGVITVLPIEVQTPELMVRFYLLDYPACPSSTLLRQV